MADAYLQGSGKEIEYSKVDDEVEELNPISTPSIFIDSAEEDKVPFSSTRKFAQPRSVVASRISNQEKNSSRISDTMMMIDKSSASLHVSSTDSRNAAQIRGPTDKNSKKLNAEYDPNEVSVLITGGTMKGSSTSAMSSGSNKYHFVLRKNSVILENRIRQIAEDIRKLRHKLKRRARLEEKQEVISTCDG